MHGSCLSGLVKCCCRSSSSWPALLQNDRRVLNTSARPPTGSPTFTSTRLGVVGVTRDDGTPRAYGHASVEVDMKWEWDKNTFGAINYASTGSQHVTSVTPVMNFCNVRPTNWQIKTQLFVVCIFYNQRVFTGIHCLPLPCLSLPAQTYLKLYV